MDQRAAQIAAELAAKFERKLKADLKEHLAAADAAGTAPLSLSQLEKSVEALHHEGVAAPVHGKEEDDSEWEEVELEPSVWSNLPNAEEAVKARKCLQLAHARWLL